ncbi:GspE/PulE/PilB domain-containing protein [Desulfogranum japonicum]|uniref:GspE/PulE/PilB domain-containing protein n=1 Tax=Desulfogranum japonicum TaxID=231447 RepID=UPI00042048CD|nr:hypothetical protein [Desulfogranum japonicum]
MAGKARLGEILVEKGLVTQEIINEALRIKAGGDRRLGHILIGMKAITDDQLKDILSDQSGESVCEIEANFSPEVRKTLPRYLCRKLCVLPLSFQDNNVLEVAMADPTDYGAILDVEHFTGKVVKTRLARYSDIEQEIPKRIPLTLQEMFSPRANTMLTKGIAAVALVLAVGLGMYTFDYIQKARYGTVSTSANFVLYQHHDLTVALEKGGKITLQGHGAYADGLYKISFPNTEALLKFIQGHEKDLSIQQKEWLQWAVAEIKDNAGKQLIAQN